MKYKEITEADAIQGSGWIPMTRLTDTETMLILGDCLEVMKEIADKSIPNIYMGANRIKKRMCQTAKRLYTVRLTKAD